jgi:hypothetical protein
MELTLTDILPYLSERGQLELEIAAGKAGLARQQDQIATLTAALEGAGKPCPCGTS